MQAFKYGTLLAVSLFLTSCTPQPNKVVPEEFKVGQTHFHKVCSNCHGSDAMGKHTKAPRLIDTDYLTENFSNDEIKETILNGTDKMPSQKNKVNEEVITEIIKYLRYSQQTAGLVVESEEENDEEADQEG